MPFRKIELTEQPNGKRPKALDSKQKPLRNSEAKTRAFGLVLGQVIAQLRAQRGMHQIELAATAGISQPQLARIENGATDAETAGAARPDAYTYGQVAQALGLTGQILEQHVHKAMGRTRAAVEAVTNRCSQNIDWGELLAIVGIAGLITFAVAAILGGKSGGRSVAAGQRSRSATV